MTDLVGRTLDRLAARLPGRVSTPGEALSHQPFLLLTTCLSVSFGFNKFNGLASRQGATREALLAGCDNALPRRAIML